MRLTRRNWRKKKRPETARRLVDPFLPEIFAQGHGVDAFMLQDRRKNIADKIAVLEAVDAQLASRSGELRIQRKRVEARSFKTDVSLLVFLQDSPRVACPKKQLQGATFPLGPK